MSALRRAAWGSAAVGVLVFLPSLGNGFAYDDVSIIVEHEELHDLGNLPELMTRPYWPGAEGEGLGAWRPLTTATLAVLWAVGDGAPWVFHTVNVLLHGIVTAGIAVLAGVLVGPTAALIAGLLFAVHPVHVEAVANAVGIAEMLSALFVLGACLVLVTSPARTRLGTRRGLTIGVCFALAVLTKENAAVLPALLVALDLWRERTTPRGLGEYLQRRGSLLVALGATLALLLLARHAVLQSAVGGYPPVGAEWLAEAPRIWTMAHVWLEYIRLMIWPVHLSPDYSPPATPLRHGWDALPLLGVALVISALVACVLVARSSRRHSDRREAELATLGILWFVIAVLPVSNLFFLSGILLAERTLYLPSAGFALVVASVWPWFKARAHGAANGIGIALLAVLTLKSVDYQPVWASSDDVFEHILDESPQSGRALWMRAELLLDAGRDSLAIVEYRRAVSHLGNAYPFLAGAGRRLAEAGHDAHAAAMFRRAWQVDPTRLDPPRRLAIFHASVGPPSASLRWAEEALGLDSSRVELWHLKASALATLGDWAEAAEARSELLARGERHAWQQWAWLAEARFRSGDEVRGREALDSAVVRGAAGPAADRLRALADSLSPLR